METFCVCTDRYDKKVLPEPFIRLSAQGDSHRLCLYKNEFREIIEIVVCDY